MRGTILYEGESVLDGQPIVMIATFKTNNRKTGDMIQTWILRSDISPVDAMKSGEDSSVCGNCPQRWHNGGACYVNIGQAPLSIWRAYKRDSYPHVNARIMKRYITGNPVRLGAYGDPAAVPVKILSHLVDASSMHTGYTHQLQHKHFDPAVAKYCMISTETVGWKVRASVEGFRSFRMVEEYDDMLDDEIICLADSKGKTCAECGLCGGLTSDNDPSIVIKVHGSRASKF